MPTGTPTFTFGNPRGLQIGLGLVQAWLDVRASAQHQFLTEVRHRLGGTPLVNVSLDLAESITKQQRDFGHALLNQVGQLLSAGAPPTVADAVPFTPPVPEGAPVPTGAVPPPSSATAPEPRASVLRLTIPASRRFINVPLQLKNHRPALDVVSFSAELPKIVGVETLDPAQMRFVPPNVAIEAGGVSEVQLEIDVPPAAAAGTAYWAEIVVAGAETRRIPLVLEVSEDAPPDVA